MFFHWTLSNATDEIEGNWITLANLDTTTKANLWLGFTKEIDWDRSEPSAHIRIAGDTKFWLWVNEKLILREGGLKWGPSRDSYYIDTISLDNYLSEGKNKISIALWHFGKDGFAHKNSGIAALKIDSDHFDFVTNESWEVGKIECFTDQHEGPKPNWRLAESNIVFDARIGEEVDNPSNEVFWGCSNNLYSKSVIVDFPYHVAMTRPIPQWKDYGLKSYNSKLSFPFVSAGDTIVMPLPYNMQVTPHMQIESEGGDVIDIRTDNYKGGSEFNVRTIYTTKQGIQAFETPGWMNGHYVRYHFPKGVIIHSLQYRETGYQTEFSGGFQCTDTFINTLWQKSARTLYITMRDNFMDCPDRERAQWWGDAVIQSGQCSYAFDRRSDLLTKKAILELVNWQNSDYTLFSPIPAGNWDQELPTQMLASVGYYGFWNYYMHTGDLETIRKVYPHVVDYLSLWKVNDYGLVINRQGGWTWGDWGNHKDMDLIFNGWYYLALKGQALMAEALGKQVEHIGVKKKMEALKHNFNQQFWNGEVYRSPDYDGETDERGQALAVISGIAPEQYYGALTKTIMAGEHCSPYFEKYVYEALMQMGQEMLMFGRMKRRYQKMVESPITTLWEGWQVGSATWGGGTYNHSWSGGPLTILSQYVVGIQPLEPGYSVIEIKPKLGPLKKANARVMSPLGLVSVQVERTDKGYAIDYDVPEGMKVKISDAKATQK